MRQALCWELEARATTPVAEERGLPMRTGRLPRLSAGADRRWRASLGGHALTWPISTEQPLLCHHPAARPLGRLRPFCVLERKPVRGPQPESPHAHPLPSPL